MRISAVMSSGWDMHRNTIEILTSKKVNHVAPPLEIHIWDGVGIPEGKDQRTQIAHVCYLYQRIPPKNNQAKYVDVTIFA